MVKGNPKPSHRRQLRHDETAAAAGGFSVLANVVNASSNNHATSRNRQLKRIRLKRIQAPQNTYNSDDTSENEQQLGLGGLFLDNHHACGVAAGGNNKPKRLLSKDSGQMRAIASRKFPMKAPIRRHEAVVRLDRPAQWPLQQQQGCGGLSAFANQNSSNNIARPRERPSKAKLNPTRSRVNSGYDAEEEKPAATATRRSRRLPRNVKQPPATAAVQGLLSIFASNDNTARMHQEPQNDNIDWLCSRLDKQCNILDEACKKRSAAPSSTLVDTLCKRIDHKATPAKVENGRQATMYQQSDHKPSTTCDDLITSNTHQSFDVGTTCAAPTDTPEHIQKHKSERAIEVPTELAANQDFSSTEKEVRYTEANIQTKHREIDEHMLTNGSHLYSRRGSSLEHWQSAIHATTGHISHVDYSSLGADERAEAPTEPTADLADKDYGCIFTYHRMNMAQISPITLASPLLDRSNAHAVGSAVTNDAAGRMMDLNSDGGNVPSSRVELSMCDHEDKFSTESNQTNARESQSRTNADEMAVIAPSHSSCNRLKNSNSETGNMSERDEDICNETAIQRPRHEHETNSSQVDNTTDEKSSSRNPRSEPQREGALRRSRRPRKQTDRLSIVFGGGARNQQGTSTSQNTSNTGRDTFVKTHSRSRAAERTVKENKLSSDPLRQGASRRSRRSRKQTVRLSIGFGGDPRSQNAMSSEGSSLGSAAKRETRVKTQPAPSRGSINSASTSNGGQTKRTFHKGTRDVRRSKRAPIPTSFFHNMHLPKDALTPRNRGQQQKRQDANFKEVCHRRFCDDEQSLDNLSVEDDFLADSATESDEDSGEVSTPSKKQDSERNDGTEYAQPSGFNEVPLPLERCRGTKRLQGLRIATRMPPRMKQSFLQDDIAVDDWASPQMEQLHQSYHQADPLSSTFWLDVSRRVDGKSGSECQAMWFSLAKTPILKRNKGQCGEQYDSVEDDIFNATPTWHQHVIPSRPIQGIIKVPMQSVGNTCNDVQRYPGTTDESEQRIPPLRQGYKKYLQDMRRDVNRAEKTKTKRQPKARPVPQIADHDHNVNMRAKLTPGGTIEVRHQEETDEWDEDMYDADEEMMDSCAYR